MITIISYILFIFAILYIKFRPKIISNDEGLFIQYSIRGKLGDKETFVKQLIKW